ncbi:MAG: hypothetical protein R6X33_03895 [Candidatus Brocadiia bacterium]
MITIGIRNGAVEVLDEAGKRLNSGNAGEDDAAVIQDAVDRLDEGGQVLLRAGHYEFERPVEVTVPVTICGEGRGTEIRPPEGDFAFRVFEDGSCPSRRYESFGTPPVHAEPGPAWPEGKVGHTRPRLHSVHIRHLAIEGHGRGKGISLACLTESMFADLWISNTGEGPALQFEMEVMETVFDNLHLSNCGCPASREATIEMKSQTGDACNNLHFRDIYVIFPQYIGIQIGGDQGPNHPRLLWFEDCMLHGWHHRAEPAPYDLMRVNKTDPARGICVKGCRLTNSGAESAYLRVCDGRVKIEDSVLGGGRGRHFLVAEPGATLQAINCTFHDAVDLENVLTADRAELVFMGNQVVLGKGGPVLDVRSPKTARISENRFQLAPGQCPLHITDRAEAPAGPVVVNDNIITGSGQTVERVLASGAQIAERDNVSLR